MEVLGVPLAALPWEGVSTLPVFLTDRYEVSEGVLGGARVIFMMDSDPQEESPAAIRRHVEQVRAKAARPVVYVRDRVTAYNRKRLIQQRVPFVVPGTQMYLPDLGIDLRERYLRPRAGTDRFSPATQAIFVWALLNQHDAPLTAAAIRSALGYSPMSISRAFDEVVGFQLAKSVMRGRTRCLEFAASKREQWALAQSFLIDPVRSRHAVRPGPGAESGLLAGMSALSQYTMIAPPQIPTRAIAPSEWSRLKRDSDTRVLPYREPDALDLEVWRYAPRPHEKPGVVDPLSLYLSLNGNADERVEAALGEMLERVPW